MTLNENIERIEAAKKSIKVAIEGKGVTVPPEAKLDEYAAKVSEITTGGGSAELSLDGTGWETEPVFPVSVANITSLQQDLDYTRQAKINFASKPTFCADKKMVYMPNPGVITKAEIGQFAGCENLVAVPSLDFGTLEDISKRGFDHNLRLVEGAFSGDTKLTYIGPIKAINAIIAQSMFIKCRGLKNSPEIKGDLLQDISGLFNGCTSLENIGYINTSSVTDTNHMFIYCSSLKTIPSWFDFSKVINASSMFFQSGIENIPSGIHFDSLVDGEDMFRECKSLKTLPEGISFPKLENAHNMFEDCTSLVSLPEGFGFPKVKKLLTPFSKCTALTSLPNINLSGLTDQYSKLFGGGYDYPNLTDIGGFEGLKQSLEPEGNLEKCPNLTRQSVLNIINTVYDFRANGDPTTVRYIAVTQGTFNRLTPEDITLAESKGWNIYGYGSV